MLGCDAKQKNKYKSNVLTQMTADTINSQSSIFFNYNKIKKITIFISNIFKKEREANFEI